MQECVDTYIRPWKVVEPTYRQYSSSSFSRGRFERAADAISPSIEQHEFEIDREFYSFEDNLTYKVS